MILEVANMFDKSNWMHQVIDEKKQRTQTLNLATYRERHVLAANLLQA